MYSNTLAVIRLARAVLPRSERAGHVWPAAMRNMQQVSYGFLQSTTVNVSALIS